MIDAYISLQSSIIEDLKLFQVLRTNQMNNTSPSMGTVGRILHRSLMEGPMLVNMVMMMGVNIVGSNGRRVKYWGMGVNHLVAQNLLGFGGEFEHHQSPGQHQRKETESEGLPGFESDEGKSQRQEGGGLELQTQEEGDDHLLDETTLCEVE